MQFEQQYVDNLFNAEHARTANGILLLYKHWPYHYAKFMDTFCIYTFICYVLLFDL